MAVLAVATVAALAATGSTPRAQSAVSSAFVRVNQVGYPATGAKRAYLMSTVNQAGASFTVQSTTGTTVTGTAGPSLGTWSNTYSFVHPLDFDSAMTPGTYTITANGPVPATSPAFKIDTGANVYANALANGLSFYEAERDGRDFIPSALRTAPAHLNDESAMTYETPNVNSAGRFSGDLQPLGIPVNASGGWWDAGDYIKGVQTLGYTTALLLHGVREFPNAMGAGSATSNYTHEAKFGTDWLFRMWDDDTSTFYFQVGIGAGNAKTVGDHDLWRLPQADDTFGGSDPLYRYIRNRPAFRLGPPRSLISPNLAGRDAAVFGLCFQVFKTIDPAFANKCLLAGAHIFDLADTGPRKLTTYIPYSFYPETEWRSDLELGATELYLAIASGGAPTGLPHDASYYLQQAAHWASAYVASAEDAADTLNLYDVSGLAHYELYKALSQAGNPQGLETSQAALVGDMKKALDGALAKANGDPFQFGFPWATWDTTSHGAGLAVMASEYTKLTGDSTYAPWSQRWLSNILGANAWGVSLIVGDGTTFPRCIHHQVANLVGSLDGTSPVLNGAAVEGPNGTVFSGFQTGMRNCPPDDSDSYAQFNGSHAKFKDDIESFSTVEPAVDLTATSPLAFAWQTVATGGGLPPPPGPSAVVSIQFDDGVADQIGALPILNAHAMHATFYVNTGLTGDADHMTWEQLQQLAAAGNEIAGHTLHHVNLKPLKTAEARQEVCGDRNNLLDRGLQPTSFAYPFGGFDDGAKQVVKDCGYNSGRGVAGGTETTPPVDAFATRTPPNPKQGTTVATIESFVTAAEQAGGGWVQLVFHHLCNQCDAYSITPQDFTELLDWLQPRAAGGTVVKTTAEVIGGPVQPRVEP
jgi:endoglucanase